MTACATTGIARPDASRLHCADEPAIPVGEIVTLDGQRLVSDRQDGEYKRELRGAWYDCHSAVQWLREWFSLLPD